MFPERMNGTGIPWKPPRDRCNAPKRYFSLCRPTGGAHGVHIYDRVCWHTPLTSAFEKHRQEDIKLRGSLNCFGSPASDSKD